MRTDLDSETLAVVWARQAATKGEMDSGVEKCRFPELRSIPIARFGTRLRMQLLGKTRKADSTPKRNTTTGFDSGATYENMIRF